MYCSNLITRYARIYFRYPNADRFKFPMDEKGFAAVKEIARRYDDEELESLKQIYIYRTEVLDLRPAIKSVASGRLYEEVRLNTLVKEFERLVASRMGFTD